MQFDPNEYKVSLERARLFHRVFSVSNLAALITLCWFSFSSHSPIAHEDADQTESNKIIYPIYTVFFLLSAFATYYFVSPFVTTFSDNENITLTNTETEEHTNLIKRYLIEHSEAFQFPINPIIYIKKNTVCNAMVFEWSAYSSQHLWVNLGSIKDSAAGRMSLQILLAHELMHFVHDLPYFSIKRFQHFTYVCNLIIAFFIYMPLQMGRSIAASATTGYRPENIYLPLIGLCLSLLNLVGFFHDNRTIERNADFCALFGNKKFDKAEYEKHLAHHTLYVSEPSFFKTLMSTHPDTSERVSLLYAAQEQINQNPVTVIECSALAH